MNRTLNILVACEESQEECMAFRERGHNAYSCDIVKCRKGTPPEWHIVGDVTPFLDGKVDFCTQDGNFCHVDKWDLIVAHPPCTYLCKVGSPWLYHNPDRYIRFEGRKLYVNSERLEKMMQAREFFYKCLAAKANYVAVENPLPMKMAGLPKPDCYVSPDWYGHKYTKKTLYWLRNLPPLMPAIFHANPKSFVRSSRGKYRSRTFRGVACAMADQWIPYILKHD